MPVPSYAPRMDATTDDDDDRDPFAPAPAAPPTALAGPRAPSVPAALPTIRELALAGLTDEEIAERLGIPLAAVTESPDVLVPLGDAHDARVARALYSRAVGVTRWAEKLDKFGDVHRLREYVEPDARAGLAWLQARQRQEWGETAGQGVRVVVVSLDAMRERSLHGATIEHDASSSQAAPTGEAPAVKRQDG